MRERQCREHWDRAQGGNSRDKDAGGTYLTAKLLLEHLQQTSKLPILPLHCP